MDKDKAKTVVTVIILFCFYLTTFTLVKAQVDSALMKSHAIPIQFNAQGCFPKKILDTILAGIPVTYTFSIEICKPRSLWFDRTIASLKFTRAIQYDNLKNEYHVTLSSKNGTSVLADFSEVKKTIENVNETALVSSDLLRENDLYYMQYHLDIKAESASTLPFPLEYLLSILPWGQSKTGWSTIPIK